ncbi:aldo/keto reductase [uncultured Sphingomonas sp.]|uniref:aldo/keto reductase n=1 Tax=uncultured Sphingomonas sp. TaxID=158754 RepID=UPI0025F77E3A|nr:aldo/keto reductase [uncultured Sphingomonas sp.]
MDYRRLGRSGLKVPPLTLGTMTFGGKGMFGKAGNVDVAGAKRMIDMSVDAGVTFIDTADMYSMGESEEIVGQAVAGRRNDLLIATKGRQVMGDGPNDEGLSRHHLLEACNASLRRLNTDHIDVYWLHTWDGQTPLDETMRALEDLTRAGKIRYVGVSNFSGWHVMKAVAAADRNGGVELVGQQIYYSLQSRDAEYELLPIAVDQGIGAVIWGPLASGLLSGKYRRGQPQPEGTRMVKGWTEPPVRDEEAFFDIVDVVVEIAGARGVSAAQVALAWLLTRPGISSLVIGARNEAQLAENLKAAELKLSTEEIDRLEKVSRPPLIYPYWHQRNGAMNRGSAADMVLMKPFLGD